MTIGDVLAVIAGVLGVGVTGWSLLVGCAVVFGRRAAAAQALLEEHPGSAFATGLFLAVVAGMLGMVLVNQPNGLFKLIGWALLLGLLATAALGGSGTVRLIGDRLRGLQPGLSPFGSLLRGAGLLVAAGLTPLIGWLVLGPLAFLVSLGAGFHALRRSSPAEHAPHPVPASETVS